MLRNYLKIAWRNLLKYKVYSSINTLGLAIGMAVALLIGLWIQDEISFNQYHKNYKKLAQVMYNQISGGKIYTGEQVSIPLRAELENKYGGEFESISLVSGNFDNIIAAGDKKIKTKGVWAEPVFPNMLSLKMLKGNANALKDVSSILIAKSLANTLFGNSDPLNQTIKLNNEQQFKVAGIYADLPPNTTFCDMKFLTPWDKLVQSQEWVRESETQWGNHSHWVFVQLSSKADFSLVNKKIKNLPKSHVGREYNEECFLQPMEKWHLYNEFKDGKSIGGRIRLVWLFTVIGIFVLLLACINFMNLATARSEKRAKEIGVRKAIGSVRRQLIVQFLTESLLLSGLSLVIAIGIVALSLPWFNTIAVKQIVFPWLSAYFWCIVLGFTILVSLIAGSYPAFYLSGFKPLEVLKGRWQPGRLAALPRKALVVVQFTVSIALIIATLVVYQQIQHAKGRPVGYNRDGLIMVSINTMDLVHNYKVIKQELLQTGLIASTAESSGPLTNINSNTGDMSWKGKDPNSPQSFGLVAVTHDYGVTAQWKIKAGRDHVPTDRHAMILNESAAKITGFKQPVGETIRWNDDDYTIVGIVEDMVMESPYKPIKPTVFFLNDEWTSYINIRVKPGVLMSDALSRMTPIFKKYNPGGTFDYSFVDEQYAKKFSDEERVGNLATIFAVLTIFISCIGLFGLTAFVAEQRTKEIGIRKVLGATVINLWQLLSGDFVGLVLISCLVAVPVSWFFLSRWLQEYDYRTEIHWWIFAVAALAILVITLLTVSFQAIKAAVANPVKSLRSE